MGDVKLALVLGFVLGWPVAIAIMVGMVSALVPSFYLLARHGMKARKMKIAVRPVPRVRRRSSGSSGAQPLLDAYLAAF